MTTPAEPRDVEQEIDGLTADLKRLADTDPYAAIARVRAALTEIATLATAAALARTPATTGDADADLLELVAKKLRLDFAMRIGEFVKDVVVPEADGLDSLAARLRTTGAEPAAREGKLKRILELVESIPPPCPSNPCPICEIGELAQELLFMHRHPEEDASK